MAELCALLSVLRVVIYPLNWVCCVLDYLYSATFLRWNSCSELQQCGAGWGWGGACEWVVMSCCWDWWVRVEWLCAVCVWLMRGGWRVDMQLWWVRRYSATYRRSCCVCTAAPRSTTRCSPASASSSSSTSYRSHWRTDSLSRTSTRAPSRTASTWTRSVHDAHRTALPASVTHSAAQQLVVSYLRQAAYVSPGIFLLQDNSKIYWRICRWNFWKDTGVWLYKKNWLDFGSDEYQRSK